MSSSDIAFDEAKQLLVSSRGQLGEKDTEFGSKVSYFFKTVKWNKKESLLFKVQRKVSFWENWQKCPI